MREYKFRGKRVDNGQWVYGYYMTSSADHHLGQQSIIVCNDDVSGYAGRNYITVIPDTVGQFTGLRDNNGKEIYEGDLIRFAETYLYIVKYEDAKFVGYHANNDWGKWGDLYKLAEPQFNKYRYVVIGNIYDNPELLNATGQRQPVINMQDPREGQPEGQEEATQQPAPETQPETPPAQEQEG